MDKRTEYAEKLSAQMVEWEAQIDRLKIKASSSTSEARHEYASTIAELQHKRDEAALELQGISSAGHQYLFPTPLYSLRGLLSVGSRRTD